jgi:hypothetical protein
LNAHKNKRLTHHGKLSNFPEPDPINEFGEHDILTGEDCDDGIADERFASPDAFSTEDYGRKSIDSR